MAQKQKTMIAPIHNVWGKSNSVYGGQSFLIEFGADDNILVGHTKINAECNKDLKGKMCQITYHETPKGTLIVEPIVPISE